MNRFVRNIALITLGQLVTRWLDYFAHHGSAERRNAWARAAKAEQRRTVESALDPPDHLYALGARSLPATVVATLRHRFARRQKSSAEIIAEQVLDRRRAGHNPWTPFQ